MAVPQKMADLSTTESVNSPAGSESPISTDNFHRAIQAILRATEAKGADIASATTTDIGAATGGFVDVTGTTTITGLGTIAAGILRTVRFTGALILTHNATSLILPGGANITTAAGTVAQFRSLGSGNWLCVGLVKADGTAVLGVTPAQLAAQTYQAFTTGGTSTAYTLTPTPALGSLTTGHRFNVTFNATAGATPTLAISGLTAKALKIYDNTGAKIAASSTSIIANFNSDVIYDGTDYVVLDPIRSVSGVTVTSPINASGATVDFTGIPSNVKMIVIGISGLSGSGTDALVLQLGDSGGLENSGYLGTGSRLSTTVVSQANSSSFNLLGNNATAANFLNGTIILIQADPANNTWSLSSSLGEGTTSTQLQISAGRKSLSATLDRFSLLWSGANTFDSGTVTATYFLG